jgi:hypothetical protein
MAHHDQHSFLVSLQVLILRQNDSYIAYCPPLELSTYGDSEDDVKVAFEDAVQIFLEETSSKGTLHAELQRMGWTINKNGSVRYVPATDREVLFEPGTQIVRLTKSPVSIPT